MPHFHIHLARAPRLHTFVLTILVLTCAATLCPAQTTLRIRLINGKTGAAFSPATLRAQSSTGDQADYLIPKADSSSVQVTFKSAATFTLSGEFKPCSVTAAPDAAATTYNVQDILDHGVVSPNTCGKLLASPNRGELILYVRPFTMCESIQNHFRGINFCY